jgi:cytochrome P450
MLFTPTMHHNEDMFRDPEKFDLEGWMDPDRAKSLDKYVISFQSAQGLVLACREFLFG